MEARDFSTGLGLGICISSVKKSNENSIEFSLSNADKGAVGLILALELASLTLELDITLEHCLPWILQLSGAQ